MNNMSKVAMVVGVAIALVVGGAAGYMISDNMKSDNNMNSQTMASTTTKSADLRVTMNNLLREHVTTSLTVTRGIVDGMPADKLKGAEAAQTANAVAIATAVGSIYGDDAKAAITTPFVEHIVQSNAYAQAVASNNMDGQATALTALRVELRKVADVFHSVIPSVSSDDLYAALNTHEELLNQSATEYKAGNFEKAYMLEMDALTQISGGAEVLSTGIIAAKPDMFK